MKKPKENARKPDNEISIEKMNDKETKYIISTSRISAVKDGDNVQNYENYINEKYLTGAIVDPNRWKKQKKYPSETDVEET